MIDVRQRLRGLPGFSARAVDQHASLYEGHMVEVEHLRAALALEAGSPPPGALSLPPGELRRVLDTRIGDLALSLERGPMLQVLAQLRAETTARGLTFWPGFYLGSDDFWTTDRATSVNVPWYLGSAETWLLVAERRYLMTEADVLRILRHEYAHALLYAYEGWLQPGWREAFGDFQAPYRDAYVPDAAAAGDYVTYLGRPGPHQLAHYAQKHADEDWAETFAFWLAGGAPATQGPGAQRKLEAVARLVVDRGAFYGPPKVTAPGRREPYQEVSETVSDYLGERSAVSQRDAALRRLPAALGAARLHELHFGNLTQPGQPGPGPVLSSLLAGRGPAGAWLAELRAAAVVARAWAVVALYDLGPGRLEGYALTTLALDDDLLPPCRPILALDCREHAYQLDYGVAGKHLGLAAQLACVDWAEVDRRAAEARPVIAWPSDQLVTGSQVTIT